MCSDVSRKNSNSGLFAGKAIATTAHLYFFSVFCCSLILLVGNEIATIVKIMEIFIDTTAQVPPYDALCRGLPSNWRYVTKHTAQLNSPT